MRMLVGIAVGAEVTEMALPASVPLAHLLPEVRAAVAGAKGPMQTAGLMPRRLDGEWLDLERSLSQQACAPGSLICLEERAEEAGRLTHYDVAIQIADRGPPMDLLPDRVAVAVVGAVSGALLAARVGHCAALVVACAPVMWTLLPLAGGLATGASAERVRRLLAMASVGFGSAAAGASGVVASIGAAGVGLDGCVAGAVLAHVGRRRSTNALLRVTLAAVQWWLVGAVLPLAAVAAGWRGW